MGWLLGEEKGMPRRTKSEVLVRRGVVCGMGYRVAAAVSPYSTRMTRLSAGSSSNASPQLSGEGAETPRIFWPPWSW